MVFGQDIYDVVIDNDYNRTIHVKTSNSEYVKFEGYFDTYSAFDIASVLEYSELSELRLNSNGGMLLSAYQLGFYIENNNISVVIDKDSICVSACAFSAIRSKNLVINNEGLLFHLPYTLEMGIHETLEEFKKMNDVSLSLMIRYLRELNFSLDFIDILVYESGIKRFVVIENIEDIEHFKSDNFLEEISAEGRYKIVETP